MYIGIGGILFFILQSVAWLGWPVYLEQLSRQPEPTVYPLIIVSFVNCAITYALLYRVDNKSKTGILLVGVPLSVIVISLNAQKVLGSFWQFILVYNGAFFLPPLILVIIYSYVRYAKTHSDSRYNNMRRNPLYIGIGGILFSILQSVAWLGWFPYIMQLSEQPAPTFYQLIIVSFVNCAITYVSFYRVDNKSKTGILLVGVPLSAIVIALNAQRVFGGPSPLMLMLNGAFFLPPLILVIFYSYVRYAKTHPQTRDCEEQQ